MKNIRSFLAGSLFAACLLLAGNAPAATNIWIGVNQSDDPGTIFLPENWDTGVVPVHDTPDVFIIAREGSVANWVSSSSAFAINGDVYVGGTNHPSVRVTLTSTRPIGGEPTNTNAAPLTINGRLFLQGSNTVMHLNVGANLVLGSQSPSVIDPLSRFEGEGMISWQNANDTLTMRDFDGIWLLLGQFGNPNYYLDGYVITRGNILVHTTSSAGVGNVSTLHMQGGTIEAGTFTLGCADINQSMALNQSGFGRLRMESGTLIVSGDIVVASDPDGVDYNGNGFTNDSSIDGAGGGTIRIGGNFAEADVRRPDLWDLTEVDLIFTGNGAEQRLEAMSADRGDVRSATLDNYCWRTLELTAGAHVSLQDVFDNHRDDTPADGSALPAEAVYCRNLIVPEGAVLSLNGLNLYCYGEVDVRGAIEGGEVTHLSPDAAPCTIAVFPLGEPVTTAGVGYWVGPLAAGDIDEDGRTELFLATIDEDGTDGDTFLGAYRYAAGALEPLSGFPIGEASLMAQMNAYQVNNLLVTQLAPNRPRELIFNGSGWNTAAAVDASGALRTLTGSGVGYQFNAALLAVDLNDDGICELVVAGRGTPNVRAIDSETRATLWEAAVPASGNIVTQLGAADVDGDGAVEILVSGFGAGASYGLSILRADGSVYTSPSGCVWSGIPHSGSSPETAGSLTATDLDGDGIPEIIHAAVGCALTVLDLDGEERFALPATSANGAVFADFDRDGCCEILWGQTLYDGDGSVIDTLPLPDGAGDFVYNMSPVLADLTGDQIPEIVYLCSLTQNTNQGRILCVYDVVSGRILDGFPVTLLHPTAKNTLWWAGQFHHWYNAFPLVADLDDDGYWEIAVGLGSNVVTSGDAACLNIIDTPWPVRSPANRTAAEIGWPDYGYGPLHARVFPLPKAVATVLSVR